MLRILLVEDNPGDVVIVREMLRTSGIDHELAFAKTLHDTLQICVDVDFNVILLDLGLPDSKGIETLQRIHAINEKSALIVMTGLDNQETALEALREGAQDYLVKGRLTPDTIVRSIRYGIERKRIQDIQKGYAQRFAILSTATAYLNESENVPSIFKILCANLRLLLPYARAIAFEFFEQNRIRISGIEWLQPWFEQIRNLTGFDLKLAEYTIDKDFLKRVSLLYLNNISELKGGISEAFGYMLEDSVCRSLEEMFNINHVYTIAFTEHKNFYGGFLIVSQIQIYGDDIHIIEAISNQTSLNIHRRSIEKYLRFSENRYRMLTEDLEKIVKKRTNDLESVNLILNRELVDRIQAEEALKKSEQQLKELNATKDKFFNIVAHDLKNPFTSLLGSSELLFQNINQLDKENIKKLAVILNDSAKSGYSILQNLLDWSRSQTGMLKFNPENLNLKQVIDDNISNLELFSMNKEIEIKSLVKGDLFVMADKNMINTVLRNLLSNAIKFSYRKSKVKITVLENDKDILITVKDSGRGIATENIDQIFRIDTKYSVPGTENETGTGLGLKLSKEFIEKQGGKIWVKSKESKGSEFSFSIPVIGKQEN